MSTETHSSFALRALVAAGHVSQERVDHALSIAVDVVPHMQPSAVAWQTMETCPRDGTVVLLRWGEDHVSPGWWSAPVSPMQNEDGTWSADNGGFPWTFFDTNGASAFVNHAVDSEYGPTHWAPYALAATGTQQVGGMEAARSEAFGEFEDDYLTDGSGYAPASTYDACSAAFIFAWPDQTAAYDAAKAEFKRLHGHDKTVRQIAAAHQSRADNTEEAEQVGEVQGDALEELQLSYDKLLAAFDRQVASAEEVAGMALRQDDRIEELEDALAACQPGAHVPHGSEFAVSRTMEGAEAASDGMLPAALVPVADEWYRLCERRFAVDRVRISGKLAEAIVEAVSAAQAVDLGQLRAKVDSLTRRVEPISGQRFSYVQLDDVLALIDSQPGAAPGVGNG